MNWANFSEKFHPSWHSKIRPFVESEECDRIYEFLKGESKRGVQIAPLSSATFRAFLETPYDEIKCIVLAYCPYHTFKNGLPIADGLALSCSITNYPQPSLEIFYSAIENELYNGLCAPCIKNPNLSFLARNGVLLLNAGLTVAMNKPGSHNLIWEPFMKYLFENVFDVIKVPIILLGKEAQKIEKYIDPYTKVFKLSHPAASSYQGTDWDSEGVFKKVEKILLDTNNHKIQWMDTHEEDDLPF